MAHQARLLLLVLTLVGGLSACQLHPEAGNSIANHLPRSDKAFRNRPDSFQFVIVGDRTGGHRPGVFKNAMKKINLLQPEFVVSVGDLIEGYTQDLVKLEEEWDEFDAMVDELEMPFFYTVGNHDMGNSAMQDFWRQRYGRDYYSFVYKNVLFLSLNTEDPPVALTKEIRAKQAMLEKLMAADPEGTQKRILESSKQRMQQGNTPVKLPGQVSMSAAQVQFVEQTLAKHKDVRWTFVMMHKPAWLYEHQGFQAIEGLLADRPYTVVAGHEHYYSYSKRNGQDYIDMGTTGGVWLQDGPGRLDHITWVTMTDKGPKIANIRLDGLSDKRGFSATRQRKN